MKGRGAPMPNAVGERKRLRLRKDQVASDPAMDKTSEDNWFVHPKIADDFIETISQPFRTIPTIRVEDTLKPRPPRRGDADAICAAEAKRARKRAKRLEARR